MSKFVSSLICAFLVASWSHAMSAELPAFGISRNSLPSALGCVPIYARTKMDNTGQYVCKSLPGGSSTYEQYILAFVKGLGICNVTAVTPYLDDDPLGDATRLLFRKIVADANELYGQPDERIDQSASAEGAAVASFKNAIISEDRQVFDQWNHLMTISSEFETASVVISGSDELGLAVFTVVRFSGNEQCLKRLAAQSGDGMGVQPERF